MLLHFSLIKLRVPKPRLWKSAPSSEQSAAFSHRPLGQCSHARSAPPLPKNLTSLRFLGALFSAPLFARKRCCRKGEVAAFINMCAPNKGHPENRRATPEIFGEEEKQYCGVCGLPFGKPLQRKCCFDEAAQRKTPLSRKSSGVFLPSRRFAADSSARNA